MKIARAFFSGLLVAGFLAAWAPQDTGSIDRLVPAINELIAPNANVERVVHESDFTWTEGPVWTRAGYLLFAEIPSNSIRKWVPGGAVTILLQPSGYKGNTPFGGKESGSNGMTLDRQGRLTVAGHAQRDVYRLESLNGNAQITVLADSYEGKRLNSPNDLVYRRDGSLYFTDPPYGLPTQSDQDPRKQLRFNGVFRLRGAANIPAGTAPEHNKLEALVKDLPRPNGIAFSPDERTLYVSNSAPKKFWEKYPVNPDGSLGTGSVFYDASSDNSPGAPDGMKIDRKGNIYSAGPGGLWIFSPDGKHLGTIHLPETVSNAAWGGADGKTLYITATSSVYRVQTVVGGVKP